MRAQRFEYCRKEAEWRGWCGRRRLDSGGLGGDAQGRALAGLNQRDDYALPGFEGPRTSRNRYAGASHLEDQRVAFTQNEPAKGLASLEKVCHRISSTGQRYREELDTARTYHTQTPPLTRLF